MKTEEVALPVEIISASNVRGIYMTDIARNISLDSVLNATYHPGRGCFSIDETTIVCQGENFTFKLDQALADNGGIYLVIEATEGQSNGVSRAHSKAVAIKMVEEPTAVAIDIRADYVAKNGTPNAAAPKIFFRYYYVNSSTGEKSGTMLTEVKLAAAAAGGEP